MLRSTGVIALLLLASCVNWTDPTQLITRPSSDLCSAYYVFGRGAVPFHYTDRLNAISAELTARRAVVSGDWPFIDQGNIRIGMSECGVIAAWGEPAHINSTVTASGAEDQLVYLRGDTGAQYVYIRDGAVTAFQNQN